VGRWPRQLASIARELTVLGIFAAYFSWHYSKRRQVHALPPASAALCSTAPSHGLLLQS
jgi:hypothetical protein